MAYFWISDTHFQHKNIVRGVSSWESKSGCRDFNTLDEHDSTIIDNINRVVGKDDTLIHLGDFAFGHESNVERFRKQIQCENIVLLYGNHDVKIRNSQALSSLFIWCGDMDTIYVGKQQLVMCHYPFQVWENNARGSWMAHGHSHNNIDHSDDGKILDMCVEGHNYAPWSFDEIKTFMDSRQTVAKDHH